MTFANAAANANAAGIVCLGAGCGLVLFRRSVAGD